MYAYDNAGRLGTVTRLLYDDSVINEVKRVYNGLGQLTTEYQEHSGAVNTSTWANVRDRPILEE